jgi:hypothetical protein
MEVACGARRSSLESTDEPDVALSHGVIRGELAWGANAGAFRRREGVAAVDEF